MSTSVGISFQLRRLEKPVIPGLQTPRIQAYDLHRNLHHQDTSSNCGYKSKHVWHRLAHAASCVDLPEYQVRRVWRGVGNSRSIPTVIIEALLARLWDVLAVALKTSR